MKKITYLFALVNHVKIQWNLGKSSTGLTDRNKTKFSL